MRKINKIVVHCSATPKGKFFNAEDIRRWHVEDNKWSDIGYHFVVLLDGTIEKGRDMDIIGSHVKGFNKDSLAICYIGGGKGEDTRTNEQKVSLIYLVATLKRIHNKAEVVGHRDFPGVSKNCPCFDAKNEYKNL